jgi:hypothetical protein
VNQPTCDAQYYIHFSLPPNEVSRALRLPAATQRVGGGGAKQLRTMPSLAFCNGYCPFDTEA